MNASRVTRRRDVIAIWLRDRWPIAAATLGIVVIAAVLLLTTPQLDEWDQQSWASLAAWATFGVYVALLIYAVQQVNEAKRMREDQTRPWVVVDFEPDFIIHFTVKNIGRTEARNVRLAIEPEPVTALDGGPWEVLTKSTMFRDGIPTLAPNREIRAVFDQFAQRSEKDLPMSYTASVYYEGPTGRRYNSESILDLGLYLGLSQVSVKGIHEIAQSIDKIQKEMHKWTDGISGLNVHVRDKDRENIIEGRSLLIEQIIRARSMGPRAMLDVMVRYAKRRTGLHRWGH